MLMLRMPMSVRYIASVLFGLLALSYGCLLGGLVRVQRHQRHQRPSFSRWCDMCAVGLVCHVARPDYQGGQEKQATAVAYQANSETARLGALIHCC